MRNGKLIAIVTGGATGIGREIVRELSNKYLVVFSYYSSDAAAEVLVDELTGCGRQVVSCRVDVRREREIMSFFSNVMETVGPPALLINNSGSTGGFSKVIDLTRDQLYEAFSVNVYGTFICCREFLRCCNAHDQSGLIINISSTAARTAGANEWIHYAASKAAIETLTKGLAIEAAPIGVRVICVAPGLSNTDLHMRYGDPERPHRLVSTVPLKRVCEPQEIAAFVTFLACGGCTFINGSTHEISGGR